MLTVAKASTFPMFRSSSGKSMAKAWVTTTGTSKVPLVFLSAPELFCEQPQKCIRARAARRHTSVWKPLNGETQTREPGTGGGAHFGAVIGVRSSSTAAGFVHICGRDFLTIR